MKKVLLVLAILAMVSPVFGAADINLWFTTSETVPGVPAVPDYSGMIGDPVTLYLWARVAPSTTIGSLGLIMDVTGGITDGAFAINDIQWPSSVPPFEPFHAWDVMVDDSISDIRMAAVDGIGIAAGTTALDYNLGTLTFTLPLGASCIEMKTSPFSSGIKGGGALTLLYGDSTTEVSGDYVNGSPLADGEADAEGTGVIPEPATMILLGLGALGVIRRRR